MNRVMSHIHFLFLRHLVLVLLHPIIFLWNLLRHLLRYLSHEHSWINLLLQLPHHISVSRCLLCWIEDTHRFEIQGANTPHEYFLQVLLHHVLVPILDLLVMRSFIQLLPEHLDFLLISSTDCLKFGFHRFIKLFLIPSHFWFFEVFNPCLEQFPFVVNFWRLGFVEKNLLWVLVELIIVLQSSEAFHLGHFHSG